MKMKGTGRGGYKKPTVTAKLRSMSGMENRSSRNKFIRQLAKSSTPKQLNRIRRSYNRSVG